METKAVKGEELVEVQHLQKYDRVLGWGGKDFLRERIVLSVGTPEHASAPQVVVVVFTNGDVDHFSDLDKMCGVERWIIPTATVTRDEYWKRAHRRKDIIEKFYDGPRARLRRPVAIQEAAADFKVSTCTIRGMVRGEIDELSGKNIPPIGEIITIKGKRREYFILYDFALPTLMAALEQPVEKEKTEKKSGDPHWAAVKLLKINNNHLERTNILLERIAKAVEANEHAALGELFDGVGVEDGELPCAKKLMGVGKEKK